MTEFEVINRVVDVDGTNKIIRGLWLTTNFLLFIFFLRIDLNLYKQIYQRIKLLTMFIEGNCAIYIDKNLKVYENITEIICSVTYPKP